MDIIMNNLADSTVTLIIFITLLVIIIKGFTHITEWIEGYLVIKNEDVNLRKIQFYADYDFFKGQDIVDQIIQSGIDEYTIEHFNYEQERDNTHVVNKKEMQDMINYLLRYTAKRITPGIEALLDQYINQNSEDELLTYLGGRISLAVLNYSNSVNSQET